MFQIWLEKKNSRGFARKLRLFSVFLIKSRIMVNRNPVNCSSRFLPHPLSCKKFHNINVIPLFGAKQCLLSSLLFVISYFYSELLLLHPYCCCIHMLTPHLLIYCEIGKTSSPSPRSNHELPLLLSIVTVRGIIGAWKRNVTFRE